MEGDLLGIPWIPGENPSGKKGETAISSLFTRVIKANE
jgi:hypothetical protein